VSETYILTGINTSAACFQSDWKKLSPQIQAEARKAFGLMLMQVDRMPGKLHFHKLSGFDSWTIHVTSDDKYKASFKIVNGVAIMRRIGLHDKIDKDPE